MKFLFIRIIPLFIALFSCFSLHAQNIGDHVQMRWQLLDNNYQGQKRSLTQLSVVNQSDHAVPQEGWSLFFSSMRSLDVASVKGDFRLEFINGDLYKLSPSSSFTGLAVNDSLKITMVVTSRIPNYTDAPGGFYISSSSIDPSIQAITDFDVLPFSYTDAQNKEFLNKLYEKNERIKTTEKTAAISIIPSPKKLVPTGKVFALNRGAEVSGNALFSHEIQLLQDSFSKHFTKTGNTPSTKNTITFEEKASLGAEAYELDILENIITIKAATPAGAFYAVQSLISLLPLQYFDGDQATVQLPTLSMQDEPRLGYRGLMLDLARNFHDKNEVLQVLDLMANYKLNTLHLHLIDDEGWRLDIAPLPELTAVGSKRSAFYENGSTLPPSYGSGAFAKPNQRLTRQEFIEILQYANERHIQVIPEIETPGHARAAIISMDDRAKAGKGSPIRDANDQSVYSSAQYWTDNVMDVGLSATFEFMETVIDDIVKMYQEAGLTLKKIHMGGDELPNGAWEKSPSIHQLMKDKDIPSVNQVWAYYVKRILEMTDKRGLELAGWEELGMINNGKGMEPNPQFAKRNLQLDVWNNVVGGGNEDLAYRLANLGYPVVFTSANNLYFDMAWTDRYEEPGHNWAAYVDLERAYGFMVHNFLRNIPANIAAKKQGLTAEGKKNIIGIKGALWAEKILTPEQLQHMLLPRVFALAERAWTAEPEWEKSTQDNWKSLYDTDWSRFANTVGTKEIPRLEKRWKNINYRIPAIGIKEINGKVACNLELPGFYIVYTLDGTEPQADGMRYTQALAEKGRLKFKVFNSSGKSSYTTVYQHN